MYTTAGEPQFADCNCPAQVCKKCILFLVLFVFLVATKEVFSGTYSQNASQ